MAERNLCCHRLVIVPTAVFVLLALLVSCDPHDPNYYFGPPNTPPQSPNTISPDPQLWNIYYSNHMPAHPSPDPEGMWSIDFPNYGSWSDPGHVNYIQTPYRSTTIPQSISITFRVESTEPSYDVVDPSDRLPATVHLFFEQQNDDLTWPDGRWWAHPSLYNLGSQDGQTITYNIPFTYDQWSNVEAQSGQDALEAAWQNIGWIGVTFGGQFFWGHGVAMDSGTARYVLINIQVN